MVIAYLRSKYSLVSPVLAPDPYTVTDKPDKLIIGEFDYKDDISYYCLVRTGRGNRFPHRERKKLFTYDVPVFIRIYVRALQTEQNFPELENLYNEFDGIVNQFRGYEAPLNGIDSFMVQDELDPLEPGSEGEGTTGFDNVWSKGLVAVLHFWKQDITFP